MEYDPEHGIDVQVNDQRGGIITRWITIATILDRDGNEGLAVATSPDLSAWAAHGMLAMAKRMQDYDDYE